MSCYKFPKSYELNKRLKDVLEPQVDEKYYLSEEIQKRFVYKEKGNVIGTIEREGWIDRDKRVHNPEGVAPANTVGGNTTQILVEGTIENGWVEQIKRVYDKEGIAPTIDTMQGGHRQPKVLEDYKVRKLTPLECMRLMDVSDEDYWKMKNSGLSDTQLYKLAGNSIVTNVLVEIFGELFKGETK